MNNAKLIRGVSLLLSMLMVSFLLPGCSLKKDSKSERTGFLFDTIITIKLWSDEDADLILDGAFDLCAEYDKILDRNDPDSDIWRINHSGGQPCVVSPQTAELISIALEYADQSQGIFDITCGRVTALWDFNSESPSIPDPQQLSDAVNTVNWQSVKLDGNTVTVPTGTELDMGGIAKGYIADRVIDYLEQNGVQDAVVNLGGNVRVLGDKNGQFFSVGIQSPFEENATVGTVRAANCSVVTAGSYQRCFTLENSHYHHILDLSTGMPANTGLVSVTVIAPTSVQADALATICFLMGAKEGMKFISTMEDVQAIFITSDSGTILSEGIEDSFQPY